MYNWKKLVLLAKENNTSTVRILITDTGTIFSYGKQKKVIKEESVSYGLMMINTALRGVSSQPLAFVAGKKYDIITQSPEVIKYLTSKMRLQISPVVDLEGSYAGVEIKMELKKKYTYAKTEKSRI